MIISVICGGRSSEHAISLRSARSVVENLLAMGHEVQVLKISKQGAWWLYASAQDWLDGRDESATSINIDLSPDNPGWCTDTGFYPAGVVFPVLHGKFGEDGAVQGLLEIMSVPCVGNSVLGSAVTMNKIACKQVLSSSGFKIVNYLSFMADAVLDYNTCVKKLGTTLFVKAASGGSSIGVEKVTSEHEYNLAVNKIFKIDNEILVEAAITGREIECAVLFAGNYKASVVGEIICSNGFYDFSTKYQTDSASLQVPAQVDAAVQSELQQQAIRACKELYIDGFARVDFFVTPDDIFINEVNSIPGFTDISLFPRMFAATDLDYPALLQVLIDSALESHKLSSSMLENVYE
jgi:D-alanine-D-alanine ligase